MFRLVQLKSEIIGEPFQVPLYRLIKSLGGNPVEVCQVAIEHYLMTSNGVNGLNKRPICRHGEF
jgi:hypothetical protein